MIVYNIAGMQSFDLNFSIPANVGVELIGNRTLASEAGEESCVVNVIGQQYVHGRFSINDAIVDFREGAIDVAESASMILQHSELINTNRCPRGFDEVGGKPEMFITSRLTCILDRVSAHLFHQLIQVTVSTSDPSQAKAQTL